MQVQPINLPTFANERNRALARKIEEKRKRLLQLETAIQDQKSRATAMQEHMQNVNQEISYTQTLNDAKAREIESETHLKHISDRERGRLEQDAKRIEKETGEVLDKIVSIQGNIYKTSENVEAMRNKLKMGKEELDEWLKVQREKEEDNIVLEKYAKDDEHKIKELSLHMKSLVEQVQKKKGTLSQEMIECQLSQVEVNRMAENFRKIHQERQELLTQLENSVKNMRQRDQEIDEAQKRFQELRQQLYEKQEAINEKRTLLENQEDQNSTTEKNISADERLLAKMKTDYTSMKNDLSQLQAEVDMLKMTLHKTSRQVQNQLNFNSSLQESLQSKINKIEDETAKYNAAVQRLEDLRNSTLTMEQRHASLQHVLAQTEARLKDLEREMRSIKQIHVRTAHDLKNLKVKEREIQIEISSASIVWKNLKSKTSRLDQELMRQQALLYNQSYVVQQLERKVRRASGERSDEEKQVLEAKIKELTDELEVRRKKIILLTNQNRRVHDEHRATKRKASVLSVERNNVDANISELDLYIDLSNNQLAIKIREKEDLMVDENILKLELFKLRSFLNTRADSVYSLENRQAQLQLALEERTKEMQLHKDMLMTYLKLAQEEKASVTSELREIADKVSKMKKKYEILMLQMAPEDGEEIRDQTYYILRASQRKEELKRENEALEVKLKKTEKDIAGLETTLGLMNQQNYKHRTVLFQAGASSEDMKQKEALSKAFIEAQEKYNDAKEKCDRLENDVNKLKVVLHELESQEILETDRIASLGKKLTLTKLELKEQREKMERALVTCQRVIKEWKIAKKVSPDEEASVTNDIELKELRDQNRRMLVAIKNVVEARFPSLVSIFLAYCSRNNIPIPLQGNSKANSVTSSTAASRRISAATTPRNIRSLAPTPQPFGVELLDQLPNSPFSNINTGFSGRKGGVKGQSAAGPAGKPAARKPSHTGAARGGDGSNPSTNPTMAATILDLKARAISRPPSGLSDNIEDK